MLCSKRKRLSSSICSVAVLIMFTINIVFWNVMLSKDRKENETAIKGVKTAHHRLLTRRDWNDYAAMESDDKRVGLGEQGKAAYIPDASKAALEREISLQNGFNAMLSDLISVNRSIPDMRYKGCRNKAYLAELPQVSIVIPFINEYLSVLLRTLHSIVNRTPPELLKEIILVDDFSDRAQLFQPLEDYVAAHFSKVFILRMPKRSGLIGARMAGARKATAEVIVYFDSHIETSYNWLPPLLEPIVFNEHAVVSPLIDVIDHDNFQYRATARQRGAFDWNLEYKRLPMLPGLDTNNGTQPMQRPIMEGGLFAISTKFFWKLGGYDEGLEIWGAEQFDLSFKVWMCGGEILDVPCSRVAHIYRGLRHNKDNPLVGDYLYKNNKRIAEVWMDEYKQYLYMRGDGIYETIDAGDISKQKALRAQLQCKSFDWFLREVAFDVPQNFPLIDPPDYAYGALQSVADPTSCLDTLYKKLNGGEMGLNQCSKDLLHPHPNQNWALSHHHDFRQRHKSRCLSVNQLSAKAPIVVWACHIRGGSQSWYYNRTQKWLVHEGNWCLQAIPDQRRININKCDESNDNMKWNFGFVNDTALDYYFQNREKVKV